MKHSITRTLAVSALGLLACATHLSAQTSAFTYQGALTQNGQPANGTYDFMFRLLDAETGGTAAPVIPINPGVGVTNGLFTTGINFDAENLNGANLWLEISVRTNGGGAFTTLAPRQLLTSAPYAVRALEATTVPQGTITSAMLADGAVTSAKIAPGAVNQVGALDGVPSNALQVNTNGLVGIGTGAPSAGLHIIATQDFRNLERPSVRVDESGGYTNLNSAVAVAVQGDLVAVASSIDSGITLMTRDYLLYQLRDGDGVFTNLSGAVSVAMRPNLLAVAAKGDHAVTLIDVTIPTSPMKLAELRDGVGGWNELDGALALAISGNLMAISAHDSSAVTLVDIANPAAPAKRAVMKEGEGGFTYLYGVNSVALAGDLLAIGAGPESAVTLVDVTDPANPVKLAVLRDGVDGFDSLRSVAGVALLGNLLAVASINDDAVTLVEVSNPANPVKLAEWKDGVNADALAGAIGVAFSGNHLAATAIVDDGVTLFDVSDFDNPSVVAVARHGLAGFDHLDGARSVGFAGENLVVASQDSDAVTVMGLVNHLAGLASAGWVGIGTTRPAGALHVVGDVVVEQAERVELNTFRFEVGFNTMASGHYSTAIGVETASSGYAATAMGLRSAASGYAATAMGQNTTASGDYSIANGFLASASGDLSTAMGYLTLASGDYSTAMGHLANARHRGSFVWSDSSDSFIESFADNEFTVRASGGYRLFSNPTATAGVSLAPNATAWSVISDRAVKKDFAAVDGREVLEKLATVPVQSWHYQWESADATPHLGPVAQDFKAAFYPGRDDKSITTLEFDGVALAAIQGLNQKLEDQLEQKQTEITELQRQNAELLKRLEAIEERLR